jgi:hypothetical protein
LAVKAAWINYFSFQQEDRTVDQISPIALILSLCEKHKIHPAYLPMVLIKTLTNGHFFNAGFVESTGEPQGNAVTEIQSLCQMTNTTEIPVSLLAVLETAMGLQYAMDSHNTQLYADSNKYPAGVIALMQAEVKALEVFRLILKQVMNDTEYRGLTSKLAFEKRMESPEFRKSVSYPQGDFPCKGGFKDGELLHSTQCRVGDVKKTPPPTGFSLVDEITGEEHAFQGYQLGDDMIFRAVPENLTLILKEKLSGS